MRVLFLLFRYSLFYKMNPTFCFLSLNLYFAGRLFYGGKSDGYIKCLIKFIANEKNSSSINSTFDVV